MSFHELLGTGERSKSVDVVGPISFRAAMMFGILIKLSKTSFTQLLDETLMLHLAYPEYPSFRRLKPTLSMQPNPSSVSYIANH